MQLMTHAAEGYDFAYFDMDKRDVQTLIDELRRLLGWMNHRGPQPVGPAKGAK